MKNTTVTSCWRSRGPGTSIHQRKLEQDAATTCNLHMGTTMMHAHVQVTCCCCILLQLAPMDAGAWFPWPSATGDGGVFHSSSTNLAAPLCLAQLVCSTSNLHLKVLYANHWQTSLGNIRRPCEHHESCMPLCKRIHFYALYLPFLSALQLHRFSSVFRNGAPKLHSGQIQYLNTLNDVLVCVRACMPLCACTCGLQVRLCVHVCVCL